MTRRSSIGVMAAGFAMGGTAMAQGRPWHMPAEEERHDATVMQWPVSREVHPDAGFLRDLQIAIADIANTISEFEPVIVLMPADARTLLAQDVTIWDIPTEDLWARDSGPVFLLDGSGGRAVTGFNFNGWGGKQGHVHDGQIARRVAARMGLSYIDSPVVGEAGGLEQDGAGLVMAHESSWINDNRNPGMTREEVETGILSTIGADRMIWAPGLAGYDITDYHIDALARFTAPGRVLIQLPETADPADPFSVAAYQTRDVLRDAGLRLTELAEPWNTRITTDDLVASYVNYYVCNGGVIAAQFGDRRADRAARRTLAALYPDREVVMLNVDPLGEVGGGIHCATQQMPSA
ncbi:agmatine deiminase family protein [Hasllibacter sp. MH4015]|uniref:agmatine deiminase family protein n=1 Tax=Hasllibacter sp. MH4015 TaxID=2854029 RepID=UPI001CD76141|nr:agmatine deiminase family protein [Hasllibacter sp. MH4015]